MTPETQGERTKYTVTGLDGGKQFEIKRGYNDFYCLLTKLQERWPGIMFPTLPPKSWGGFGVMAENKTDAGFYTER